MAFQVPHPVLCPAQTPSSFPPLQSVCSFQGTLHRPGWRIKGRCVVAWPSSSASSPSVQEYVRLCPGRKTQLAIVPGKKGPGRCTGKGLGGGVQNQRSRKLVVGAHPVLRLVLASSFYCSGDASQKSVFFSLGLMRLRVSH